MPLSIVCLVFCTSIAAAVQLPFLANMTLVSKYNSTTVTLLNRSCDQCLCESNFSHSILNCFPNNTCQLFVDAPRTYKFQPTPNAVVYFPRQVLPNASEGCMPNTSHLLNLLNSSTPMYANVSKPLCLLLDDHGYLVTVSQGNKSIVRYDPNNLTTIDQPSSPVFFDTPITLAHHDGAYYVGFDNSYILVVDSNNLTQIHNISTPFLDGARDMIFLNNGQQMLVASTKNDRLVFFNRSSPTSHNYDYIGHQNVSCKGPHGLFYVSDALFYLTSFITNTVYAYSSTTNNAVWSGTLVLNASSSASSSDGAHITIDDCDRYWFSLGTYGVQVFDKQGSPLGSLYPRSTNVFDTLMLDNYVIYQSDLASNRIIRLDPHIQC